MRVLPGLFTWPLEKGHPPGRTKLDWKSMCYSWDSSQAMIELSGENHMKNAKRRGYCCRLLTTLTIVISMFSVCPLTQAQNPGNNAVYNSSNSIKPSLSFIDVSNLPQGFDLCDTIYRLFTGFLGYPPYPSAGAVIDARGATNLTCSHGSPWTEGANTVTLPSTILLPATTAAAPIVISSKWILPSYTHLIGQGDAITPNGFTLGRHQSPPLQRKGWPANNTRGKKPAPVVWAVENSFDHGL